MGGWCADMEDNDRCIFDGQCKSGYCSNGMSRNGVCSTRPKYPAGTKMHHNDGAQCQSGNAGLWNDQKDGHVTYCCRTGKNLNNWAKGWCADMENNDRCIFDGQCKSGYCRNGMSSNGVCAPKDPAGTEKHHNDAAQCQSGNTGLWNDRKDGKVTYCCRTGKTIIKWEQGWCADMETNDRCIFDGQCKSGYCRNGISSNGVCGIRPTPPPP